VKKRLVYNCRVHWGNFVYVLTFVIFLLTLTFLLYAIQAFMKYALTFYLIVILFGLFLPLIVLNIIFLPVMKDIILKKSELVLYTTGFKIKNKFLMWKQIKSISFNTGRLKKRTAFFRGAQLPMLQKIYILDKKGIEYSCNIDIDYWGKKKREENNLRKLNEFLLGLNQVSLLSDWAEKR